MASSHLQIHLHFFFFDKTSWLNLNLEWLRSSLSDCLYFPWNYKGNIIKKLSPFPSLLFIPTSLCKICQNTGFPCPHFPVYSPVTTYSGRGFNFHFFISFPKLIQSPTYCDSSKLTLLLLHADPLTYCPPLNLKQYLWEMWQNVLENIRNSSTANQSNIFE